MSLVTRCPNCDTTFKVTLPQLQAHRGDVRCGRCAQVFDAFADLSTVKDTDEASADNSPDGMPDGANDQWAEDALAGRNEAAPDDETGDVSENDKFGDADNRTEARDEPDEFGLDQFSELGQLPDRDPSAPLGEQEPATAATYASTRDDNFPPLSGYAPAARQSLRSDFEPAFEGDRAEAATDPRTLWLWLFGSLFLLILLLGQAAFVFRSDLAARFPGMKPALQAFCGVLGCVVPLPQKWEMWTIESSDLKSLDEARPGRIELSANLRNRARYALAYPALELTLIDVREEVVARRIFMPKEYLPANTDFSAGLAGNNDLAAKLTLDTGDLKASGYRLFVLYP